MLITTSLKEKMSNNRTRKIYHRLYRYNLYNNKKNNPKNYICNKL